MAEEWTPTRVATLIALWTEGLTTSEIGRRLNVTKNAVVGKVHRLGLPKRGVSPQSKAKAVAVIRLENLKPSMCRWPEGEPGTDAFHFCGKPSQPEKPYCTEHCQKAYVKPSKERKVATRAA